MVLQARHTASDVDTEGRVYGTYRSPSLIIRGDDFTAIGVTFINLSDRPLPGSRGSQAVAVRATGRSKTPSATAATFSAASSFHSTISSIHLPL